METTSVEFQSKSSEDGVRMVYLHLNVIGKEIYNPLQSYDRFLPSRWAWARGVDEPMLYFSYQYQVLSLGLLKNQVRDMEVTLSDEPRGCVAGLTSSCKDIIVGTTLLKKVTDVSVSPLLSEDVGCVSVVKPLASGLVRRKYPIPLLQERTKQKRNCCEM